MRIPRSLALVSLVAVLPLACDEDEPAGFSTGVDGNKPLGTLNGAEAQAVCNATQSFTSQAIAGAKQQQLTCQVTATVAAGIGSGLLGGGGGAPGGASAAQLQMTCQMTYDRCMMNAPPAPTPGATPTCQMFPAAARRRWPNTRPASTTCRRSWT